MKRVSRFILIVLSMIILKSCSPDEIMIPPTEDIIYKIPVVVHVVHLGEPMSGDLTGVVLGEATGPQTDLPGAELFLPGEPFQPEGILVNAAHFSETEIHSQYNLGRTLTHEAGHYLGLLHTWGTRECSTSDYCNDTPPVVEEFSTVACDGGPVMKENYMTYSPDSVMNVFTNDQIKRMHYVLENSPFRTTLTTSPVPYPH